MNFSNCIPVALYMLGLWFVRDRFCLTGAARASLPVFAALVLLAALTPVAIESMAAVMVLAVVTRNMLARD